MIGQQKRSLEHSVSPQPTKYQKHCDDNFCETSTRVASPTGEQLGFQELFSGVQSIYAPSSPPATDFDSLRSGEKALDLTYQPRKQKKLLEIDQGAKCCSCHKVDSLFDPSAGFEACKSAGFSRTEICCEIEVDHCKDSKSCCVDLGNHADDRAHSVDLFSANNSEHAGLPSAEDFTVSHKQREAVLKNASEEWSPQSGGNECGSSSQKDEGPSTTNAREMGVEADRAFLDRVKKTLESRRLNGSRPVFLSGKVINLYLMNEQVKAHGGYQSVTSEGLWGRISQTLGFVQECGPGVKLIYFKYLKGLERETSQSLEAQHDATALDVAQAGMGDFAIENRLDDEKSQRFSPLVGEQFAENEPVIERSERRSMIVDESRKTGVSHRTYQHFQNQIEKHITGKEKETGTLHSFHKDGSGHGCQRVQSGSGQVGNCVSSEGWEETQAQSSDRHLTKMYSDISGPKILNRDFENEDGRNSEEGERGVSILLEENHQPFTSTLIWIKRMALDPGNPHMGEGVEGAGQSEEWVKDCASQAEKIRGCLWKWSEEIRVGEAQLHQAKQLPTPSHYYEELPRPDQQSGEGFRATRERVAQYGYPGSPGLHRSLHESSHYLQRGSSPQSQSHWSSHRVPRQSSFHSSYTETAFPEFSFTDRPRKRIPIGPDFQAHVPSRKSVDTCERAGPLGDETQSSDEDDEESGRWFGKQVWPLPGSKSSSRDVPVGAGRALRCACLDPESMDCVRNHVQEEGLRLEQELGQAFYVWKFDEMGERVANRWTKEEERIFRALVKMNPPSLDKNFWEQLPDAFPCKKMRDLVSYYFNVFVLRRRAVQNRLEGRQVDSDDDETELPEGDSGDSEDYDSGEEPDEDPEEDASEGEEEIDQQNDSYAGGRSGKLLEHTGFCDPGGVNLVYCSTNTYIMETDDDADGVSIDICTSSGLNLENEDHDFRRSRREERNVRFDSAQLTSKWSHEQDEEKHLENHVDLVGDEELQEVKTWEDPHWDQGDHDQDDLEGDTVVDATFSGKADHRDLSLSRSFSGHKPVCVGDDQRSALVSCEHEVWVGPMDNSPRKEGDKLLSTNGMIQELFGEESAEPNSPR